MARHLLSDAKVRKAPPTAKKHRLADGDGLYLYVAPSGIKSWQLRYRLNGKPQTATIGKYPVVSLAEAREAADKLRKLVAEGKHLTAHKRVEKMRKATATANTFEAVSDAWVHREARRRRWTEDYRGEVEASIRNHLGAIFPLPLGELTAPLLAPILDKIEDTSPHMLPKVKQRLHGILNDAVVRGLIPGNPLPAPSRGDAPRLEKRSYPAITALPGVGEILRAARAADPAKGVQRAHQILVYTAQRISEVVGATWAEIDFAAEIWRIPRERMKMHKKADRGDHEIPLPAGLLAALREWKHVDAGTSEYVCPAPRDPARHITREAVEKFYRRTLNLANQHSPHSWRSVLSTTCRNHGKADDLIETQLDHVVGNASAAPYDHAKRVELRRELLQWYESQLLAARDGADIVAFKRA
ncbi:MAG: DUF4102 domain-containing protein [Betaproteobacteria bacterium]|nr:DUF4102 domain-containing protein [Betaproteobacteria bacterium]